MIHQTIQIPPPGGEIAPIPSPEGEPDLAAIAAKHPAPPAGPENQGGSYVLSKAQPAQPKALETADVPEDDVPANLPVTTKTAPAPAPKAEGQVEQKPEPKGRLAPMLRRERELRQREESFKAGEAQLREKVRAEVLAEFGEDPGKIMREAGKTPTQVAEKLVKPGKVAPADPVVEKLAALEREMADLRAERQAKALEAEVEEMHQEIRGMVGEDPQRWPLLTRSGQAEAVVQVMLDHSEKHGEVLSDEDAADIVEARLAELLNLLSPPTGAAPKPGKAPAGNKGPRTTSSTAASAAPARGKEPLPADDEQALQILAERADRTIREGRAQGKQG